MALQTLLADRTLPDNLRSILENLSELALDLRWTWNPRGEEFWASINAPIWRATANPHVVLQNLSMDRLEELARDETFQDQLAKLKEDQKHYLAQRCWGNETFKSQGTTQIAYFSMEFGIDSALPLYAGGLGILAGDFLKSASDLEIPLVGVSLMYHVGYFRQIIDAHAQQQEIYAFLDSSNLPLTPVLEKNGGWLRFPLEFPGRQVFFRVWKAQVGSVSLYLLDSNDPLNLPSDQGITSQLYGGTEEERLMQELVLGIGGWRVLKALGLEIDICHLNEGHAALVTLERARDHMQQHQVGFDEALWTTRAGNLFTTHTPLPAGFDVFPAQLMRKYLQPFLSPLGLAEDRFLAMGQSPHAPEEPFNMAYFAMRTCARANGVSRLHGKISQGLFHGLYPRWPEFEVPVGHVTNGIHMPTWISPPSHRLWHEACGPHCWREITCDGDAVLAQIDDTQLWNLRARLRQDLIRYVRSRLVRQAASRGIPREHTVDPSAVLDANVLTLGFARRFTEYKRPNLLLRDLKRLTALLADTRQPMQLIVAGKAHPHDQVGKAMLEEWIRFSQTQAVRHRLVFLDDYDMTLAKHLVQGVDVWVNTPRRPWEACGTSGMKVLINGGLNLSTLDGWWAEAYQKDLGWVLDAGAQEKHSTESGESELANTESVAEAPPDNETIDQLEAEQLYDLLEQEVVPEFYRRNAEGVPLDWIRRIRRSMSALVPGFSANRMLQDYSERYYLPATEEFRQRMQSLEQPSDSGSLYQRFSTLESCWEQLHWGHFTATRSTGRERFTFRFRQHHQPRQAAREFEVQLYLGDVPADTVQVELYAEEVSDWPRLCQPMEKSEPIPGALNGYLFRTTVTTQRPAQDFTPRVIPNRSTVQVPMEASMIFWWSGEVEERKRTDGNRKMELEGVR